MRDSHARFDAVSNSIRFHEKVNRAVHHMVYLGLRGHADQMQAALHREMGLGQCEKLLGREIGIIDAQPAFGGRLPNEMR